MSFAIDEIAYASPAKNWPPLGKFFLALALLIVSLLSSSILIPLVVLIIGFFLLFYSTRLRFPRAIAIALLDAMLIVAIGAVIIAFVTSGETLWSWMLGPIHLEVSKEGMRSALLVFTKAMAGILVMLFFATSTPIPHFAHALRQIRMPAEISELFILVYRYSFLLLEQLEVMYLAATCRLGFKGWKNKLRTTSKLAVGLFIRSLDTAERSQIALNCRSFRGDFPTYRPPARMGALWILIPLLVFASLFLLNVALSSIPLGL